MLFGDFYKMEMENDALVIDISYLFKITFQGNNIVSLLCNNKQVPIDSINGFSMFCDTKEIDGYYIILDSKIYNISNIKYEILTKLSSNSELISEIDSLKLAIELVLL